MNLLITDVLYYLCQKLDNQTLNKLSKCCKRFYEINKNILLNRKKKRYLEDVFMKRILTFKKLDLAFDTDKKEVFRIGWDFGSSNSLRVKLTEVILTDKISLLPEYDKKFNEFTRHPIVITRFNLFNHSHVYFYLDMYDLVNKFIARLQYLFTELYKRNYNLRN